MDIAAAKTKFESAMPQASPSFKAKLSTAVGILDGLTGGTTKDTAKLPTAEEFLPDMPQAVKEVARWLLMQAVQAIDPTNGFAGAEQIVEKFTETEDPEDPEAVKKLLGDVAEGARHRDASESDVPRAHPRTVEPNWSPGYGPNPPPGKRASKV